MLKGRGHAIALVARWLHAVRSPGHPEPPVGLRPVWLVRSDAGWAECDEYDATHLTLDGGRADWAATVEDDPPIPLDLPGDFGVPWINLELLPRLGERLVRLQSG